MLSRHLYALAFVFLLPQAGGATTFSKSDGLIPPKPLATRQVAMTGALLPSRPRASVPLARNAAPLLPPVSSPCISSPFGPRILPNHPQAGTYHYGIDLPAPEGAPVFATEPGKLIRIQHSGPGGLEMLVQHDGYVGVYSHLGMVSPTLSDGKMTI